MIRDARKLRASHDPYVRKHVFINADLTRAESKALYDQRCRRRAIAEKQLTSTGVQPLPDGTAPSVRRRRRLCHPCDSVIVYLVLYRMSVSVQIIIALPIHALRLL